MFGLQRHDASLTGSIANGNVNKLSKERAGKTIWLVRTTFDPKAALAKVAKPTKKGLAKQLQES